MKKYCVTIEFSCDPIRLLDYNGYSVLRMDQRNEEHSQLKENASVSKTQNDLFKVWHCDFLLQPVLMWSCFHLSINAFIHKSPTCVLNVLTEITANRLVP